MLWAAEFVRFFHAEPWNFLNCPTEFSKIFCRKLWVLFMTNHWLLGLRCLWLTLTVQYGSLAANWISTDVPIYKFNSLSLEVMLQENVLFVNRYQTFHGNRNNIHLFCFSCRFEHVFCVFYLNVCVCVLMVWSSLQSDKLFTRVQLIVGSSHLRGSCLMCRTLMHAVSRKYARRKLKQWR